MIEASALAAKLDVDASLISQVMAARDQNLDRSGPWYVQAILVIGAWIAGCALIGFGVAFTTISFNVDEPGIPITVVGLVFLACGLFLLLADAEAKGVFRQQFAVTLAAAATALIAGGLGFETESLWVAVIAAMVPAAFIAWKVPGFILQTLTSALTIGLFIAALVVEEVPYQLTIISLALVIGTVLLLYPPRIELRPTAISLLFAAPLSTIVLGSLGLGTAVEGSGWFSRAMHIALFLWLVITIWRGLESREKQIVLIVLTIVALTLGAIMPPGGSAVLLIIVLAYVLGSRLLAVAGILLEAYYLSRFYYDLEFTLLTKSMMLVAAGVLLLVLWAFTMWAAKREAEK
ncbi:MAG: DUF4401 domain-containing protein [Hyphomicrobiales bacterium]|nr:DUF4401 domain-containing protein [Hyphomicrobiales bacterium]